MKSITVPSGSGMHCHIGHTDRETVYSLMKAKTVLVLSIYSMKNLFTLYYNNRHGFQYCFAGGRILLPELYASEYMRHSERTIHICHFMIDMLNKYKNKMIIN